MRLALIGCCVIMPLKKILEVYFKTIVCCIVILLLCHFIGLTEDISYTWSYGVGHAIGMAHPNNFAALIMNAVFLGVFLYMQEKTYQAAILLIGMAGILYNITVSRTVVILMITLALLLMVYSIIKKLHIAWVLNLLRLSLLGVFAGSIYLMIFYNRLSTDFISDTNFWARFSQGYLIYKQYGIHLFGNKIHFVKMSEAVLGKNAVILDNGYMSLLLYYGSIATILFLGCLIYFMHRVMKNKNYILFMIIALFLLAGLMEKTVYTIQYNFTLVGMFCMMQNEGEYNETRKIKECI